MSAKWFHDRMGFIGEGVSYRRGLMYLGDNVCVQRWLRTLGLSTPLCHLSFSLRFSSSPSIIPSNLALVGSYFYLRSEPFSLST